MSENDFDFSLPKASEKPASGGKWKLLCALQLLTLVCVVLAFLSMRGGSAAANGSHIDTEKQLDLAQRLEKQGLAREAAQAWKEYLEALNPDAEKEAKLWYRIGVIQQEGRLYEEALASFYRSDMAMKVPVLETEITRRTQECLAALGKAVAMKRNLEERTSVGASSQTAAPLVSIGDWKLTRDEVEAMAEREIEMMLASSNLPEEQMLERKKQMLKQLNQGEGLTQFTMHLVTQEMLYRAAMDDKLMEDASVRDEVMRLERNLLAESYMRRRLVNLNASDAEIEDFYKAHPEQFTEPAAVRLAHIEFADEESANAAMKSLVAKQEFGELAKLLSKDKATADKEGQLDGWFTASNGQEWTREAAKGFLKDEKLAVGEILPTICKGGNAWHIVKLVERRAEKVRAIKEAFEEARQKLMERKSHEAQDRVMQELARRYQVIWNLPSQKSTAAPVAEPPAPASQNGAPAGGDK